MLLIECENIEVGVSSDFIDVEGVPTLKPDKTYVSLSGLGKAQFTQESKKVNGNIVYEQKMTIKIDPDYYTTVEPLPGDHLIVKVSRDGAPTWIWGEIANPIQAEIKNASGIYELTFFRDYPFFQK